VEITLEMCCRTIVDQRDALDGAPGSDTAQIDRQVVPLVRIQGTTLTLRMRRYPDPVLVDGTARGQMTAIVELQIHRDVIGRIAQVARVGAGEDQVGQPRICPHRQVRRKKNNLLSATGVAAIVQRMQTTES